MASDESMGGAPPPRQNVHDKELERKQRNREYRVAAKREKRNRKADEKKQRKLNATILRRMTRNPDKYHKNAERNRLRDIEGERRKIYQEAVWQAKRLAAIHDPSGVSFNVCPVVVQEDGTVISQDALRRRQERATEKAAPERAKQEKGADGDPVPAEQFKQEKETDGVPATHDTFARQLSTVAPAESAPLPLTNGFNPERFARIAEPKTQNGLKLSKTQIKKRAKWEPRPAPPKPILPHGVLIPEGDENWIALWDLSDEQLERRIMREKKRRAAERKALRAKQKSGKAERRVARDEKRRVYREIKLTWKAIKEEQTREKTKLKAMEDEESKKIAVDINVMERKAALDCCTALGFTVANTSGTDEIKPKALGMKGVEVDFNAIEAGATRSTIKSKTNSKRVDLGSISKDEKATYVGTGNRGDNGDAEDFITLDVGEGQDHETLNYNHKLRRKLRRAIDDAEIRKETLVRQHAIDYYKDKGMEPPAELLTPYKPLNVKCARILENGTLETAKQERVRARMELAEFNTQMRVLRKQAKEAAIYAGLKKYAELTGRIPTVEDKDEVKDQVNKPTTEEPNVIAALEAFSGPVGNDKKRAHSDFEGSSASDQEQLGHDLEVDSKSDESSDYGSSASSGARTRGNKRQKVQNKKPVSSNIQSQSMNSERQAMIDVELALGIDSKGRRNCSLREVDANAERAPRNNGYGKAKGRGSASNWNINGLPGDKARKSKFVRLLGGEKHSAKMNANNVPLGRSDRQVNDSNRINADLERQYDDGLAYKENSKRKGLGA